MHAFDTIICSHVLEHVPADAKAMSELFRVLRPGGVAIIQVPYADDCAETDEDPSVTDPLERERRFGQFDHVRIYGRDFADRLRRAGFVVDEKSVRSANLRKKNSDVSACGTTPFSGASGRHEGPRHPHRVDEPHSRCLRHVI